MYNKNKIEPKLSPSMYLFYFQVDIILSCTITYINLTLSLPVTGGQNKNSRKCLISFFFNPPNKQYPEKVLVTP